MQVRTRQALKDLGEQCSKIVNDVLDEVNVRTASAQGNIFKSIACGVKLALKKTTVSTKLKELQQYQSEIKIRLNLSIRSILDQQSAQMTKTAATTDDIRNHVRDLLIKVIDSSAITKGMTQVVD